MPPSHPDRRLVMFGLTASLVGCAKGPDRAALPLVALVMKSLANPFFVAMTVGARADEAARKDRYRLLVNGTRNESDLAQQVAIIDQMIAAQVDAIVVAPSDSKAVVAAAVRALKAGIAVINIDNRLDRSVMRDYGARIPFVGPDDRQAAERVGLVLAQSLSRGDQVAILEGITTADNSRQRREGLRAAALSRGLEVVTIQSANWDQAQAATLTSAILLRYPGLRGVLCANDTMALGAASAIEKAGRAATVRATGFDNLEAIRPLVKRGLVAATADQHGAELAIYGINYALDTLGGARSLPDRSTPVDIVTADSLAAGGAA